MFSSCRPQMGCRPRFDRCPAAMQDCFDNRAPTPTNHFDSDDSRTVGYSAISRATEFATLIPEGARARGPGGQVEVRFHGKGKDRRVPGAPAQCMLCCDNDVSRRPAFGCEHLFCEGCIQLHCAEKLVRAQDVVCPMPGCKADVDLETLKGVMRPYDFDEFLVEFLRMKQRLQTCPAQGCGAAVYLEELLAEQMAEKRRQRGITEPGLEHAVRCPSCTQRFCLVCGQGAHPRHTCEEARRGRAKRQPEAAAANPLPNAPGIDVKECPRCSVRICKANEEDCDHMTCRQCRKEFCWQCLADRQVIYAHGNHFHKPTCRFFAAYTGPREYLPDRCPECHQRGRACRPPRA
mmetsp:Transcript_127631/g.367268  ORF Transcript_127631/g.367268 Transcript_127631/m.367268 type:complete len:348 (-) Transcript_127631:215-1258(-)